MPLYFVDEQGNAIVSSTALAGDSLATSGSGGSGGGGTTEALQLYTAFIDGAVGGETSLAKPPSSPPIPNNETTELYIDGRKVRRGADKVFTVAAGGGSVNFAPLLPGQDVELRFYGA
jgi:hypothetical protein